MPEVERPKPGWMDFVWLVFLAGLALQDPWFEIHKEFTLLAIGVFQIFEYRFLAVAGPRGRHYSVLLKIALASFLLQHTGGINSSYYLIYFLPVVTAAMFFGPWATLGWTALTSAAYCYFLIPALRVYVLDAEGATELAIRNMFFFLAAIAVNRFVMENRRQARQYRELAEQLAATNRQLAAAQEEARRSERLAALGQLTAGLAHEIRNPLGIIKGSAETLDRRLEGADPLARELAGYISSEVNRLNSIVTRFLDFARPAKLELQPQEIPPLVERALRAAAERWPDANVRVEREFAEGLPVARVDADLVQQALTNLVMNAYEALSGDGDRSGTLRVAVAPAQSDGRRGVEIEIEDSGPGVPPELREQIFNPFFTTKKSGVGLGLAIVSKIVDDHRGSIRLVEPRNASGKGACFRVFLPAE